MIRVEGGLNGQGQNLPGLGIHDHGHPPFGRAGLDGPLQLFLHEVLNVLVNGQDDFAAVQRLAVGNALGSDGPAQGVLGDDHVPGLSANELIIPQLHPFQPLRVQPGKTDDMHPQLAVGVESFGLL